MRLILNDVHHHLLTPISTCNCTDIRKMYLTRTEDEFKDVFINLTICTAACRIQQNRYTFQKMISAYSFLRDKFTESQTLSVTVANTAEYQKYLDDTVILAMEFDKDEYETMQYRQYFIIRMILKYGENNDHQNKVITMYFSPKRAEEDLHQIRQEMEQSDVIIDLFEYQNPFDIIRVNDKVLIPLVSVESDANKPEELIFQGLPPEKHSGFQSV